MKIIVEFHEIKETAANTSDAIEKNRLLNDTAFQFQNFKLDSLKTLEPKDLEVVITLYYDANGHIKWAFKAPTEVPEAAKTEIREALK